ncbi:MAG: lysophospholipid acyltransferase family protein [Thermoanaerobaculia bacterium]
MNAYLRVTWRLPWLLSGFFACAFTVLVISPLDLFAPALRLRLRNRALTAWGRSFCATLGIEVTATGTPPRGDFILVANHVSYVDIPLLASLVEAAFVAKTELAGWPLLGRAFQIGDTIFIDRARKRDLLRVMERVHKCLERGLGVAIFPEGTSGRGEKILPLKASLLELAVRQQEPVHYATLSYKTHRGAPATDRLVCWWDDTPFLTHLLRLLAHPGFEATVDFGARPIVGENRKQLADRLQRAMQQSFVPMADPGAAATESGSSS